MLCQVIETMSLVLVILSKSEQFNEDACLSAMENQTTLNQWQWKIQQIKYCFNYSFSVTFNPSLLSADIFVGDTTNLGSFCCRGIMEYLKRI